MKRTAILSAAIALLAGPALAHTGAAPHNHLLDGLAHPFAGLDHMLAMLGVGIFAFQSRGRALWLLPASFVVAMAAGGALGFQGAGLPGIELGIAGSVLLVGFLIALAPRLPGAFSAGLVALFAICHGFAHGAEAPEAASPLAYFLGFLLATALLHAAGIAIAAIAARLAGATRLRLAGGAIAAAGLVLIAS